MGVVSQGSSLGPQFEEGAESDHMEIGVQRNCIWRASFPGSWPLKMSNGLKNKQCDKADACDEVFKMFPQSGRHKLA